MPTQTERSALPGGWEVIRTTYPGGDMFAVVKDGWQVADFVYSPSLAVWLVSGRPREPIPEFVRGALPADVRALLRSFP